MRKAMGDKDDSQTDAFIESARESVADGSFVKITLSKHRGGDDPTLKNIYVKPVFVKGAKRLSFIYRHSARDMVKNYLPEDGLREIRKLLGEEFLSCRLFTTNRDSRIEFNKKREARIIEAPPTFTQQSDSAHDRRKTRFIETEGNIYLHELGVTNERGETLAGAGDKFRQINKFVEIIASLYKSSPLSESKRIEIVDMGSGKGYLTFAVYDYFRNALGVEARVLGVEAREELVELCNRVARKAGFDELEFRKGMIRECEIETADMLIALHACDTATDEALYKGIKAEASIIVAAPCCHKEVRPQLKSPEVLEPLLKHGILQERQAEMLTDALRSLLLESRGYKTRIFEFISTEHTRKNTMIAAVRRSGWKEPSETLNRFEKLKKFYGIESLSLERLLNCG